MDILVSQILADFQAQGLITAHHGPDNHIRNIHAVEDCVAGDLVFVDNRKYLSYIIEQQPAAVVTTAELVKAFTTLSDLAILISPNVRLAAALLRQRYHDRPVRDTTEWGRIHPSSVIHASVHVPDDVIIAPNVVIGAGVSFGQHVVIMAGSVIEHDVQIGDGTVIHPNCVVGYQCEIGREVILKSGCIIGSEGHGFAQDAEGRHYRIPQVGKVVIEDRVVIGANCTIDRATYTETRIHSGCIIDALCHIAHNVVLGDDCILIAQTGIAGSSRFGKRVIASGQTGVLDHVTVPNDTVLLHRAGVINSIKKSGVYAGTPPQPFKRYVKNIAILHRLDEVWNRLKALEKKVAEWKK